MHAGRLFSPSSSIVPSHISYDATPSPIMLSNRLVVSPESMFMSLFAYEAYFETLNEFGSFACSSFTPASEC